MHQNEGSKSSLLLRERGRFSPTRYFVEEVIGFDETDLYRSWVRASSTRSPQERNTRLENMCWRIWNLARQKKQRVNKRRLEHERGRREATADMSEDLSEGEKGDPVSDASAHGDPNRARLPRISSGDAMETWANNQKGKKLYIVLVRTLWLQDSPSEDITSILYDVFDYFEDVREQGGRVFVHCCQGVSRSTSLVIAYLMWREGQSFHDPFQFVKATRGIADPNMGFTCQLLQCQKRVHAIPLSPSSLLRIYKNSSHSPYDPLHLVPKMLMDPSSAALDSKGVFIVHIPSTIYVWIGKNCEAWRGTLERLLARLKKLRKKSYCLGYLKTET
ncbi:hypothetical protein LR48_Vigan09g054000 [Vigna angularis]|uniref:Protein-tyrosine-phosphatase n=1 Tax=Phaseolus angularis TaxID=3914 RepID=A0A0L9V9X3_PHAAN|nr:hypothetical protein LR48_Vigan09g054000 [Vigna angularis]